MAISAAWSVLVLAVGMVGSRDDGVCERTTVGKDEGGLDQSGGRRTGRGQLLEVVQSARQATQR